jgi:hypothetical protein
MKYEVYAGIEVADDFNVFDFLSFGKNGIIPKRVAFTKTEGDNIYNLAFGDVDGNGEINDYSVSDNGDRNKILATVAKIVEDYTRKFPDRWIIFRGSTDERTRLYRMGIGLNFEELSAKFVIYDYDGENVIPFVKGLKINTFLVKRKNI